MKDLSKYGIAEDIAKAYAENLQLHIECVGKAGRALGVHELQLEAHDESKWSMSEFPYYADWFMAVNLDPITLNTPGYTISIIIRTIGNIGCSRIISA
jgi:hypothetical protein